LSEKEVMGAPAPVSIVMKLKKIPFKTNIVSGKELVMVVGDVDIRQIRFNVASREIYLYCQKEPKYDNNLDTYHWSKIKKLVEENNGTWENKEKGIDFLKKL
jgi:hypothetical protein